jgi:predicted permease
MNLDIYEIVFRIGFIYLLILIGLFLRFFLKDPDNSPLNKILSKIILRIFFPFLVISSILNVTINSFFIVFISISFCLVVIFAGYLSVFLYSRFNSIPSPTLGSIFLAVSFPNSIFLPFPLILMLIGPQGLLSATLFAVTIIVVQNSLGSYIGIYYGSSDSSSHQFHLRTIFKKILVFPPALSMIIGFLLKIHFQPTSFENFVSFLPLSLPDISFLINVVSWLSLILALLLVGLTFNISVKSLNNRFLISTSVFRLIFSPFVGILFLFLIYQFIFPLEVFNIEIILPLLIQAFSGPAIINIAFSKEFSLDVPSQSVYITFITLFSLILLPFLVIFVLY